MSNPLFSFSLSLSILISILIDFSFTLVWSPPSSSMMEFKALCYTSLKTTGDGGSMLPLIDPNSNSNTLSLFHSLSIFCLSCFLFFFFFSPTSGSPKVRLEFSLPLPPPFFSALTRLSLPLFLPPLSPPPSPYFGMPRHDMVGLIPYWIDHELVQASIPIRPILVLHITHLLLVFTCLKYYLNFIQNIENHKDLMSTHSHLCILLL